MPRKGRSDFFPATLHRITCTRAGCNSVLKSLSKSGISLAFVHGHGWSKVGLSSYDCGGHS